MADGPIYGPPIGWIINRKFHGETGVLKPWAWKFRSFGNPRLVILEEVHVWWVWYQLEFIPAVQLKRML
jgi:hypothetical protein